MLVFGILHHVVHTLYLGAHLQQLLAGIHNLLHGSHERRHETLEGHEHTDGKVALQDIPRSHQQDRHRQQVRCQRRQQAHLALLDTHLTLLIEHPAPQTAPVLEEPFLGTCGLDALDVLQATNRGGIILTHALLCTPDHIQALAGIVVYDGEVDEGCRDADHRQYVIVRQHQYEVQHQQHHVDSLRCQHLDERMGDGLIESLPLLQVAHEAHGEEAHGQSQQVAQIVDVAS